MSKPTKSLTESKMEQSIPADLSTQPYNSRVTFTYMRQCEAREWLRRYRTKASSDGAEKARQWWRRTMMDIERIRGLDAANELRHLMNLERSK